MIGPNSKFYPTYITHTCGHTTHHMKVSPRDKKIIARLQTEPCFDCKYGVQIVRKNPPATTPLPE